MIIKLSFKYHVFDRNVVGSGVTTSRLGGIAVFLSFFISICMLISLRGAYHAYLTLIPLILLFLVGLYDDLFNLTALLKLSFQVLVAFLATFYWGVVPFNNLIDFSLWNSVGCHLLSMIFIIFMINAFNLIDGIDGLAAVQGIIVIALIAIGLVIYGDYQYAAAAFIFCSALTGFLFFNISPATIYLGDSGSMITGFMAVIFSFRLLALEREISGFIHLNNVYVLALFIVPLYDACRVVILRLLKRQSPFKRDQNHIHHRLRLLGWSDGQIVLAVNAYTIVMVLITFSFQGLSESLQMLILFLTAGLTNRMLEHKLHIEAFRIRINRNI
ncbi:MraY family glycosyltransferase [Pedobacter sp.]|uniref:MraY family glycosyltransferase n=1 Tax=Pedobacter sp. TaxID=1411316 RepID=UPI003D7F62EA